MSWKQRITRVQNKAVKSLVNSLLETGLALYRAATGTGKTRVGIQTVKKLYQKDNDLRILWIIHKKELVNDAADELKKAFPSIDVGIYGNGNKDTKSQFIVASVQTLTKCNHLKKFKRKDFDLVVVDECHHTPAATWKKILNYFKSMRLGLTATPYRPDGALLTEYFGGITVDIPYKEAVKKRLIAKDNAWLILTNSVLQGVTTSNGEYKRNALDRLFESGERNRVIVKSYKKYGRRAMDKMGVKYKSICFCINVEHAKRMRDLFRRHSIKSEILVSDGNYQTTGERDRIYQTYRDTHNIEMLCVVDIFNEGINVPDIVCGLMSRPTRSNIIYQQQVGRPCRFLEGIKEEFILLDFIDNTTREFQAYTIGNLKQTKPLKERIVTEYLNIQDPITVQLRVDDVVRGVEEFERIFRFPSGHWQVKENVINAAKECKTVGEFRKKYPSALKAAKKYGWYDECCSHMDTKPYGYWKVKENCINTAKECKTVGEFSKKYPQAYFNACTGGWINECRKYWSSNRKPKGYWRIKDNVINAAKECKTASEFDDIYPSAYQAAKELGWFDECKLFWVNGKIKKNRGRIKRKRKPRNPEHKQPGHWQVKENVIKAARTCKSKGEFIQNFSAAYKSARENGWLKDCYAHLKDKRKPKGYWNKKKHVFDAANKCDSFNEFRDKYGTALRYAYKNDWADEIKKLFK